MIPPMMNPLMFTTMGSTLASLMFIWAIITQYCPNPLRILFRKYSHKLTSHFHPYITISIHEFSEDRLSRSDTYSAVEAYLFSLSDTAKRLKAEMLKDTSNIVLTMDEYENVTDNFHGAKVSWALEKSTSSSRGMQMQHYPEPDKRYYKLVLFVKIFLHKKHKDLITKRYLDHVVRQGKETRVRNRQRKLYTNSNASSKWSSFMRTMWSHVTFEHPATFETMAMEPETKKMVIEDLVVFSESREFYERIGKAWKRGYLLYGPPGSGKSTMIAAMANLLGYDVYDLELTAVKDNTELRKLLIETTSKSIIVIEDIDCSLDLTGQRKKKKGEKGLMEDDEVACRASKERMRDSNEEGGNGNSKVTLSGLLNFIDGLWSSCGGERLVVFTTNYVEKLDPALIRRGRMDKHIELSYCSFEGFKVLVKNYLRVERHEMFGEIERLMGEVKMTPADVAENLMPKSPQDDPERCLVNLIQALEEVKKGEEAKKKEVSDKDMEQPQEKKDVEVLQ